MKTEPRSDLEAYLNRHFSTKVVGLVIRIYERGRQPSDTVLSEETERIWQKYSLRGVFTGEVERDPYEIMLALNYAHGSLARAHYAYARKDYATAAASYTDVLSLFDSDEATLGLQRCRQKPLTATNPSLSQTR